MTTVNAGAWARPGTTARGPVEPRQPPAARSPSDVRLVVRAGRALRVKTLLAVGTAGGTDAAYAPGGYNRYPVSALLRALEVAAHRMGMTYAEPTVLYGVPNIPELTGTDDPAPRVDAFAGQYRALLAS